MHCSSQRFNRNFLACLQLVVSSFLLFRVDISSLHKVKYFSHKRKLHFLVTLEYMCASFCFFNFLPFDLKLNVLILQGPYAHCSCWVQLHSCTVLALHLGKCSSIRKMKQFPISVSTFLLYGGLNHAMFLAWFLCACGASFCLSLCESLYW